MSFRISKYLLQMVAVTALLGNAVSAWADIEQDRAEGIAWLLQNQNGDGSWGVGGAKVAATSEALAALRNSGANSGFLYSRAISWLANVRTDSVDSLARKISALEGTGFNTVDLGLTDALMGLRNEQKGWGAFNGHSSGFPDTALALEAIQRSGIVYADLNTSIGLIQSGQAAGDSGWSYMAGSQGASLTQQIMPSAYNVIAMSVNQTFVNSSSYITRGVNWLMNTMQQTDGSFLEDATITTGVVHKTALGYMAIKNANDAGIVPTGSTIALANAQAFILTQQLIDGSWGNDAFTTGLALRTLPTTVMIDTDGDGIPDAVELLVGTNVNVADGRELLDANGLDPDQLQDTGMTAQPVLREAIVDQPFTYLQLVTGGTIPIIWSVYGGILPVGIALNATTGELSGTPTVINSYSFTLNAQDGTTKNLRVAGYINILDPHDITTDTDQDGIPSSFEVKIGTDSLDRTSQPLTTDTDNDGVVDWIDGFPNDPTRWLDADYDGMEDNFETLYGLDPTVDDSALDFDGDGISNLQEYLNGTDPSGASEKPVTGVKGKEGNKTSTISWTNIVGARTYNIYWSVSPGVTKVTGTKIANVTNPYVHTGLVNRGSYYYIVTVENAFGESPESSEVKVIPDDYAWLISIISILLN